jgi:hypothetical protein
LPDWSKISILPISDFQQTRITGVSHRIWLINFYGYNFEDNSNFRSGRKKKRYELGVARWVAWKLVLADFPLFVPKLLQEWIYKELKYMVFLCLRCPLKIVISLRKVERGGNLSP